MNTAANTPANTPANTTANTAGLPCTSADHRPARDRGQATVEFALVLPFACLLLTGFVQVAVVVRDQLALQAAAREAARAASVAADGAAAASQAARTSIDLHPLEVSVVESGELVTATVGYLHHTDVPLIGPLLPDIHLDAAATMTLEPP